MRKTVILVLVVTAFFTGILAGRAQSTEVTMRGLVKDANTLPEEIQYWEVREREGLSITIAGPRTLPLIAWLRSAKDHHVVLTITREGSEASAHAAESVAPRADAMIAHPFRSGPDKSPKPDR